MTHSTIRTLRPNGGDDLERALDASAVLAFVHRERGYERVASLLDNAIISSVNWSEVAQKCHQHGVAWDPVVKDLLRSGLAVIPFSRRHAETAATLWPATRDLGLAFADRACLALAMERNCTAVTADRAWSKLGLNIAVELIR